MILSGEQKCLLWLSSAEITPGRVSELSTAYHGAEGIWESFDGAGGPEFQPAAREKLRRFHSRDALDELCGRLEERNVRLLFRTDPEYPQQLKAIADPPYLLYYAGRLSCLERPMVAVVGTRQPSAYGQEMACVIAQGLCDAGVCVVSGLARGIDVAAHKGALAVGGHTAGVLGSGINVPYPSEHTPMLRKIAGGIGLVLSEYPLDAEPVAYHFPHRNRIISGLSLGVVFVEGKIKSGGMHTVGAALSQGREVFAVPGRVGTVGSEGPHTILREGARIITCAGDVLDDLGLQPSRPGGDDRSGTDGLSALQVRMLGALRTEPLNVEDLACRLCESPEALISELGMLEILGRVTREAGNRFALPVSTGR